MTVAAPPLSPPAASTPESVKFAPKHGPQFDLYSWLVRPANFYPSIFFIGFILAILACSIAGRSAARHNIYENFHRFHPYINPSSLYYPTASQLISLVEAKSTSEQTIVILGGNSVFYGLGQSEAELWSSKLQNQLGNKFAVFNFAMPASEAFENAYWTAEALLKKKRKVIFATVAMPIMTGTPDGSDVYGYGYWDAKEKNLLWHDKTRDVLINEQLSSYDAKKQVRLEELRLRSKLDSLLYFEDLWTSVAYSKFFTVWTGVTAKFPWTARKELSDDYAPCVPLPIKIRFRQPNDVGSVKRYCRGGFELNTATPREAYWLKAANNMRCLVPMPLRRNCLVAVSTHAPDSLSQLNKMETEREKIATEKSIDLWQQFGYNSIGLAGKLQDEDFMDSRHLLPSGGQKIADVLATEIVDLNQKLYGAKK